MKIIAIQVSHPYPHLELGRYLPHIRKHETNERISVLRQSLEPSQSANTHIYPHRKAGGSGRKTNVWLSPLGLNTHATIEASTTMIRPMIRLALFGESLVSILHRLMR